MMYLAVNFLLIVRSIVVEISNTAVMYRFLGFVDFSTIRFLDYLIGGGSISLTVTPFGNVKSESGTEICVVTATGSST